MNSKEKFTAKKKKTRNQMNNILLSVVVDQNTPFSSLADDTQADVSTVDQFHFAVVNDSEGRHRRRRNIRNM